MGEGEGNGDQQGAKIKIHFESLNSPSVDFPKGPQSVYLSFSSSLEIFTFPFTFGFTENVKSEPAVPR